MKPLLARGEILGGSVLGRDERADIVGRDFPSDVTLLVGADAAAAILNAYRSKRLPMECRTAAQYAPGADAYLSDVEILRRREEEKRRTVALAHLPFVSGPFSATTPSSTPFFRLA